MEWFEDGNSLWDYCETKKINEDMANDTMRKLSHKRMDKIDEMILEETQKAAYEEQCEQELFH